MQEVTSGFQEKRNISGVIGAIDGSHIQIRPPAENPEIYVNRKGFHSIILQAVCDYELNITHAYAGWPGSVHDARVFRRSKLMEKLENNVEEVCPEGTFILGDAAYPLRSYLLVPFKETGKLSPEQRRYNFKHSSTRMKIEHCFGILKGRWRRLKYIDVLEMHTVLKIVMAAALMHNICNMEEEDISEYLENAEQSTVNNCENLPLFYQSASGTAKRLEVMQQMND